MGYLVYVIMDSLKMRNNYVKVYTKLYLECSPPCSNCTSASDCLSCIDGKNYIYYKIVMREVVESKCVCQKGFFENE